MNSLFSLSDIVASIGNYLNGALQISHDSVSKWVRQNGYELLVESNAEVRQMRYIVVTEPHVDVVFGNHDSHRDMAQAYLKEKGLKQISIRGGGYIRLLPQRPGPSYVVIGTWPLTIIFDRESDTYRNPDSKTVKDLIKSTVPNDWIVMYKQCDRDKGLPDVVVTVD